MAQLTLNDVKAALGNRVLVASAKAKLSTNRVVLEYIPSTGMFQLHNGWLLDNAYSTFGTQLAIDRFNELVGP